MKRLCSLIAGTVVFIAVFFCASFLSFAAPSQITDIEKTQLGSSKTYYSFNAETKTLTISGEGAMPNFSTSQSFSDAQPWYDWRSDGSIEHIVVEEGITSLGNYCFYSASVADINIPSTLQRIGSYSLANNPVLETIDLKNVTSISNYAFYMCYGLKKISIPSTVTSIGKFSFAGCRELNNVNFANQYMIITIDEKAFFKCPELKRIIVPFNAKLKNYSVGFTDGEKVGTVAACDDFVMHIFIDSSAYDYAKKYSAYSIHYTVLDEMVIHQGTDIERRFFNENLNDKMIFSFAVDQSAGYSFCITGSVKAECVLTDSDGNVLKKTMYNPITDDKCKIDFDLIEGNTYYYTISSLDTMGNFEVSLMPLNVKKIEIDWGFNFQAADLPDGMLEIERLIQGLEIHFVYDSGFVYSLSYSDGAEYNGLQVSYSNKLDSKVMCGENTDSIVVGDLELPFMINVEHSYTAEKIEPTIKDGGYTRHTCVLCGDKYTSDFTEPLGRTVYGYVKIMSSPNGDLINDSGLSEISVYNNVGELIAVTDEKGFFVAEYAYDYIVIESYAGPDRIIAIDSSSGNLGDIGIVFCDFNGDAYVNAKDFALINSVFGEYDCSGGYESVDINKDGVIDMNDWSYASSYFTYGKLDESIYN